MATPRAPAPFLVEHAALLSPGRTLDLAAGEGRNSLFLARRGHRVLAADIARGALKAIFDPAAAIDRVQMDFDHPGIRDASLDSVVCINFLDRTLFPQIARWLRPGGTLLVDTFLIDQREIGHPRNPRFLLGHGELRERLAGYRLLRYREGAVRDQGELSFRSGAVARREKLTSRLERA